MTSSRFFTRRPVRCEVRGPLTAENAADIAQWCGGKVMPSGRVLWLDGDGWHYCLHGDYLLRHPDGSFQALTPEELDEGWVEEGADGVSWERQAEVYKAALMCACIDGWADGAGAFQHYVRIGDAAAASEDRLRAKAQR